MHWHWILWIGLVLKIFTKANFTKERTSQKTPKHWGLQNEEKPFQLENNEQHKEIVHYISFSSWKQSGDLFLALIFFSLQIRVSEALSPLWTFMQLVIKAASTTYIRLQPSICVTWEFSIDIFGQLDALCNFTIAHQIVINLFSYLI